MSDTWLPMCGQTWLTAAGSFVGMWSVMMVAMMLPAVIPMLWRYREALGAAGEMGVACCAEAGRRSAGGGRAARRPDACDASRGRATLLAALAGVGYFCVWLLAGVAVFPLGAGLAVAALHVSALARATPLAAGVVVVLAGALQFTAWKARRLACCRARSDCGHGLQAHLAAAWLHGARLGLRCAACCGNLMLILLVVGVMDVGAMAVMTVAIAAERLAPARGIVVRVIGAGGVGLGVAMVLQAIGG